MATTSNSLVAVSNTTLKCFDLQTSGISVAWTTALHNVPGSISYARNGKFLVCPLADGAQLFTGDGNPAVLSLKSEQAYRFIRFSSDGKLIMVAKTGSKILEIYHASTLTEPPAQAAPAKVLGPHDSTLACLATSSATSFVAGTGDGGQVYVYDVSYANGAKGLVALSCSVELAAVKKRCVAVHPHSSSSALVAVGTDTGPVLLWTVARNGSTQPLALPNTKHRGRVVGVAFFYVGDPSKPLMATCSESGQLFITDCMSQPGKLLYSTEFQGTQFTCLCVREDMQMLAAGTMDGKVILLPVGELSSASSENRKYTPRREHVLDMGTHVGVVEVAFRPPKGSIRDPAATAAAAAAVGAAAPRDAEAAAQPAQGLPMRTAGSRAAATAATGPPGSMPAASAAAAARLSGSGVATTSQVAAPLRVSASGAPTVQATQAMTPPPPLYVPSDHSASSSGGSPGLLTPGVAPHVASAAAGWPGNQQAAATAGNGSQALKEATNMPLQQQQNGQRQGPAGEAAPGAKKGSHLAAVQDVQHAGTTQANGVVGPAAKPAAATKLPSPLGTGPAAGQQPRQPPALVLPHDDLGAGAAGPRLPGQAEGATQGLASPSMPGISPSSRQTALVVPPQGATTASQDLILTSISDLRLEMREMMRNIFTDMVHECITVERNLREENRMLRAEIAALREESRTMNANVDQLGQRLDRWERLGASSAIIGLPLLPM